jgi:hypothetical protein
MKTLLLLSLVSSLALAQQGVCKSGQDCTTNALFVKKSPFCYASPSGGSFGYTFSGAAARLAHYTDAWCGTRGGVTDLNLWEVGTGSGGYFQTFASLWAAAGSAANPSLSFSGDTNTGFYSSAADNLAMTIGGAQSLVFRLTGYISSPALNANVVVSDATGAQLTFGANGFSTTASLATVAAPTVLLSGSTSGVQFTGVAPTSFQANPRVAQIDANTGRFYWNNATPAAAALPFDLGASPHPILNAQRLYVLDVGQESTATPTFNPAPRVGASSAVATMVDTAAATTAVIGTAPNQWDARGSVTAAAAGSISSMISSQLFVRRSSAQPRWCQKVSLSANTTVRVWLGLATALPGSTDNPAASSHVSWRFSPTDAKWAYCVANGAGTTCTATSAIAAVAPAWDALCIDCREGAATACTFWINGVAAARVTSGLPTALTAGPYWSVEATAAAARTLWAGPVSVEMN